ncbi:hypothetical protein DICA0_B13784 [Diutina catenulata]
MYFISTQIQARHEEVESQERRAEHETRLISTLQSFRSEDGDAPAAENPPTKPKRAAPAKKKPKRGKTEAVVPAPSNKRKPKRPKQPSKHQTLADRARHKFGLVGNGQKKITQFMDGPTDSSRLVNEGDWQLAIRQLRLKFPRLHPKYKRSLQGIQRRMEGQRGVKRSLIVTPEPEGEAQAPEAPEAPEALEAQAPEAPSLWDQAAETPSLGDADLRWLYDLEGASSDGESCYSDECSEGGVVTLTQEGEILEVDDSEYEPDPIEPAPVQYQPLVSFQGGPGTQAGAVHVLEGVEEERVEEEDDEGKQPVDESDVPTVPSLLAGGSKERGKVADGPEYEPGERESAAIFGLLSAILPSIQGSEEHENGGGDCVEHHGSQGRSQAGSNGYYSNGSYSNGYSHSGAASPSPFSPLNPHQSSPPYPSQYSLRSPELKSSSLQGTGSPLLLTRSPELLETVSSPVKRRRVDSSRDSSRNSSRDPSRDSSRDSSRPQSAAEDGESSSGDTGSHIDPSQCSNPPLNPSSSLTDPPESPRSALNRPESPPQTQEQAPDSPEAPVDSHASPVASAQRRLSLEPPTVLVPQSSNLEESPTKPNTVNLAFIDDSDSEGYSTAKEFLVGSQVLEESARASPRGSPRVLVPSSSPLNGPQSSPGKFRMPHKVSPLKKAVSSPLKKAVSSPVRSRNSVVSPSGSPLKSFMHTSTPIPRLQRGPTPHLSPRRLFPGSVIGVSFGDSPQRSPVKGSVVISPGQTPSQSPTKRKPNLSRAVSGVESVGYDSDFPAAQPAAQPAARAELSPTLEPASQLLPQYTSRIAGYGFEGEWSRGEHVFKASPVAKDESVVSDSEDEELEPIIGQLCTVEITQHQVQVPSSQ